jgi:thioredoxin reductase (NADPH)
LLVVVDADRQALTTTETALVRRFEPDYRVVTAGSPAAGLATLEQLASSDEDVALIAADLRLPGMDGVAFLERAQALHRHAGRVLLLTMDRYHTRIPFTELATPQRATALGRIDFLDCQRVGEPGGVAVSAGAGGAERVDDHPPAPSCGVSHRR